MKEAPIIPARPRQLPHAPEEVMKTAERIWADGVKRRIQGDILTLQGLNDFNMFVKAETLAGVSCPITCEAGDKPQLLVPEGEEVAINFDKNDSGRIGILGVYVQQNNQPDEPPTIVPLRKKKDGNAGMYIGNEIVFWEDGKIKHLQAGAPATLYVVFVPERHTGESITDTVVSKYAGKSFDDLFGKHGSEKGVNALGDGEQVQPGVSKFEPDVSNMLAFILSISYAHP